MHPETKALIDHIDQLIDTISRSHAQWRVEELGPAAYEYYRLQMGILLNRGFLDESRVFFIEDLEVAATLDPPKAWAFLQSRATLRIEQHRKQQLEQAIEQLAAEYASDASNLGVQPDGTTETRAEAKARFANVLQLSLDSSVLLRDDFDRARAVGTTHGLRMIRARLATRMDTLGGLQWPAIFAGTIRRFFDRLKQAIDPVEKHPRKISPHE